MPQNQQPAQNQTPVVSPSGGAVVSTTPAASLPTVNPNAAFQNNVQAPAAAPTPAQTPAPVQVNVNPAPQEQPKPATNAPGQSLAMPATGSVVDLLNAAGQDSSFAARQKLAQQYGIQGYTGTAAQNIELSKKYQEAYNANKSLPVPQTGAEARAVLGSYFDQTPTQQDPQKSFFDEYMAMNPVVKTMYDTINQQLSSTVTQQTFTDEYNSLLKEQGIPALQTELMNIRNIMDGTEDDIRNEITKAGGFATDSQVMAISAARNKTLLKQANILQQQLALKEDYVDQLMQFSEKDRATVDKEVQKKLGLAEKLASIQDKITSSAKENYVKIVDRIGYAGLANLLKDDSQGRKMAETALGLPRNALSNAGLSEMENPKEWSDPYPLGGDYVQKNLLTGEVKTAVNVPQGKAIGGGAAGTAGTGSGGATSTVRDPNSSDYLLNLMDSTRGRKMPNQVETIRPIQKSLAVINQLEGLQASINKTTTDPIIGKLRQYNPYDFDARAIQAQLQAVVPNLARGVYGEVGVLTDQDIQNYIQTLPNIKSTQQQNDFVMAMTLRTVQRNFETQLETLASAGYDVSGFKTQYQRMIETVTNIEKSLGVGQTKPGTRQGTLPNGTKVTMNADGTITDAQGNMYDKSGKKISSSLIPWGAITIKK